MVMNLESVVPWGRSFEEYVRMFALSQQDREGQILGCGDGPAAFNSVLTGQGGRIVSCDPLYLFSTDQIRQRIDATFATVMAQVKQSRSDFVWEKIGTPEELGRLRLAAMAAFLADFEKGREEGRYLAAALPQLPFATGSFDLAICSHLLFLYSAQLSFEFHLAAVAEMARVAREVRIFPLIDLAGRSSAHLEPIVVALERGGYEVEIGLVPYEFQRGGNEMMRVRRREAYADGQVP